MINVKESASDEAAEAFELLIDGPPELRAKIGRHLGDVRRERKISQETLARAIQMSRPHLSNVELGRSRSGWPGLRAMAEFFDLDIWKLAENLRQEPVQPPVGPVRARPGMRTLDAAIIASNFTEPEIELVALWRDLDPAGQRDVLLHAVRLLRQLRAAS
jgi:transcriptional regulator with XRE-family HTH domain